MSKSRSALMSAVALGSLALVSPSLADGGPGRRSVKDAPPPPPVHSWTGLYLGVHLGAAMSQDRVSEVAPFYNGPGTFQNSGRNSPDLLGGVQAGYNFQFQSLVFGIEGDLGWMDINRSTQFPAYQGVATRVGDSIASLETGWYGAITGRLGITLDPKLLIYAKAGWGFVDSTVSYTDTNPTGITLVSGTSRSGTLDGAVYGAGLEWAFNRNWSVKAEYLHFDLGSTSVVARGSDGVNYTFRRDLSVDTVKAGLNYKF